MQFDKIRFDGANVELEWKEPLQGGGERDVSDRGKDPTPAFKAALHAFRGYVVWVHSWPEEILERVEVRGVTIKRPDDAPRGIVVTATLKCPRARNSTSTVNTPYLAEPPAGFAGERTGFLPEMIGVLVDDLENEASLYQSGERGEQTTLALGDENIKQANDRMAAAEVASTRKPKGKKKGAAFVPGVGEVANPDATEPVTNDSLRQLLLSVERDVPIDAIALWSSSERDAAFYWATASQRAIVGQVTKNDVPEEPECVKRDATLPLTADAWTETPPPALDSEAVHAIQDASRGD